MAGERLSESRAFLFLKLDVSGLAQWRRRPGTSPGETQRAVKPQRKRTMRMHTGAGGGAPLISVSDHMAVAREQTVRGCLLCLSAVL